MFLNWLDLLPQIHGCFWIRGCGTTFVISPFLSKKKTAKEGEIVRKAFTIHGEVCYYSLVNIIML
ncbi:hypothetical protein EJW99_03150 [Enterococcus faecium]|nr:hypothetical protein [Enterococcus faecium]